MERSRRVARVPGEQGHENVEREHVGDFGEPGAKNRSGDITEERGVTKHMGVDAKGRRSFESLDLRTQHLLLGKVERRKERSDWE